MNDEQVNVMHHRIKKLQQEVAELTSRVKLGEERYHRICDRLNYEEDPKVTITALQFAEAWRKLVKQTNYADCPGYLPSHRFIDDFAKELGL